MFTSCKINLTVDNSFLFNSSKSKKKRANPKLKLSVEVQPSIYNRVLELRKY